MRRVLFLCQMLIVFMAQTSYADPPRVFSYQGYLTNSSGTPLNGTLDLAFRIYNVEAGGLALWQETHGGVAIENGVFDVVLGEGTPLGLSFSNQYWIGITVPAGTGTELTPRTKLSASPYSFHAVTADTALVGLVTNADKVDGFDASATPSPNQLLALDSGGKFPASTLPGGVAGTHRFQAYQSGQNFYTACGGGQILFNSESFDSDGDFFGSTFTVSRAGVYWFSFSSECSIENHNSTFIKVYLRVNGAKRLALGGELPGGSGFVQDVVLNGSSIAALAVGDQVTLTVEFCGIGNNQNLLLAGGSIRAIQFSGFLLSP